MLRKKTLSGDDWTEEQDYLQEMSAGTYSALHSWVKNQPDAETKEISLFMYQTFTVGCCLFYNGVSLIHSLLGGDLSTSLPKLMRDTDPEVGIQALQDWADGFSRDTIENYYGIVIEMTPTPEAVTELLKK